MWEEINKKQNEDEMKELLYYSGRLYDNATRLYVLGLIVLTISIIISIFGKETAIINGCFFVILLLIGRIESKCIENAAQARNLFDALLFDFEIKGDKIKIQEKAYLLCKKNTNDYNIKKNNTGTDTPPGYKNWYTKNNGKNKNEIIFKCQRENIKWDKTITKVDLIVFLLMLVIIVVVGVIKYYNETVKEVIGVIFVAINLIYEIIKRICSYISYNMNLKQKEYLLDSFSENKITKQNIKMLQDLIEKRRHLNLVPLNFIHKKVTNLMHELISKFN